MVIISFGVPKILMIRAELLRVLLITTDFAFITQKLAHIYTQPLAHTLLWTYNLDTVGQGPTALAVGAGGGCLDIFTLLFLPLFGLVG